MKKKILSLFAVVFVLAAIVCAFSVTVSAENVKTPSVSIDKFNLVFEDNVYLKYAVKFDGVDDEKITSNNIGMLYFTAPQTDYTNGGETYFSSVVGYTTISGQKYYTFEYRHITAKQMTDYIYSVAYIDLDGERYYSAPVKYSVLDYCYSKLGKTGTASENADFIDLLTLTLEQGAAAQRYFKYNTERLANDEYYLVEVVGGTLEDGFTKGLYHAGETATLTALETNGDETFKTWKNSAGESVSEDNPYAVTTLVKNETYTASYESAVTYSEGLEFTPNGDGTCFVSGIGTCTDSDIVIPKVSPAGDEVTFIGDWAFAYCFSLESALIPDGVKSIGYASFAACSLLTSIVIPDSVEIIGEYAFAVCHSLTGIEVAQGNNNYESVDGNLYTKGGKTLLQYAIGKEKTKFKIPDSVTNIGNSAFHSCTSLTSIVIGDSVTSIGDSAFINCESLTTVVIGDSVTSIGDDAFYNCDSLTNIVFPDSVTSIGGRAFLGCNSLTSVVIGGSVTRISDFAFGYCTSLTNIEVSYSNAYYESIDGNLYTKGGETLVQYAEGKNEISFVIPYGVTCIGDYAFCGCSTLTSIEIPDSVISIGDGAFEGCYALVSVHISDIMSWCNINFGDTYSSPFLYAKNFYVGGILATELVIPDGATEIKDYAFSCCSTLTSIEIPDSVISIGDYAFSYCDTLTRIVIGNGVESIGDYAFDWCSSLTSVVIGANIASIGDYAFYYCDALTSVVLPDSVKTIGDCAFADCHSLTNIVIPDSATSIGDYAFSTCAKLRTVAIGDSVTSIGDFAFSNCHSLISIEVSQSNACYESIDGNLCTKGGGTLVQYALGKSVAEFTIPDSFTNIGIGAFAACESLSSVYIHKNIISIGDFAFSNCYSLTHIEVDKENYNYESIDGNLYTEGGKTLVQYAVGKTEKSFEIPSNVEIIGDYAFSWCNSLVYITIPNGVMHISDYAFAVCESLTSVVIPDSVTSIGNSAFEHCPSLTNINYDGTIAQWGRVSKGYEWCTNVTVYCTDGEINY